MSSKLRNALPDLVGLIGLGTLARGLWVGFGEHVALIVVGALLIALAVAAALRGGD